MQQEGCGGERAARVDEGWRCCVYSIPHGRPWALEFFLNANGHTLQLVNKACLSVSV